MSSSSLNICNFCTNPITFSSTKERISHVRKHHLNQVQTENGIFYRCCLGPNGVCQFSFPTYGTATATVNLFRSIQEFEFHYLNWHIHSIEHVPKRNWSSEMCTVNLPAVLNDPNHRKKNIFSKLWGDHFEKQNILAPPHLYEITIADFSDYIQTLRRKRVGQKKRSLTPNESSKPSEPVNVVGSPLKIPQIFFDAQFSLDNESNFQQIIPLHYRRPRDRKSLLDHELSSRAQITHMQKLSGIKLRLKFRGHHENLSHFLDAVELQIVQQVSTKSASFFDAILCHDAAREKIDGATQQVKVLRQQLKQTEKNCVFGLIKLLRISRRMQNLIIVRDRLKLISTACSAQPSLQAMLNQRDYFSALEVLHSTLSLLTDDDQKNLIKHLSPSKTNEAAPPLGRLIRGLNCVRHLNAQLREYPSVISHIAQNDFESSLVRFFTTESQPLQEDFDFVIVQIVPCLLAFLKLERFDFVQFVREAGKQMLTDQLQQHICHSFKDVADQLQPPSLNGSMSGMSSPETAVKRHATDNHSESSEINMNSSVAEQLRSLATAQWISFFQGLSEELHTQLQRLHLIIQVLESIIFHCCAKGNPGIEKTDFQFSAMLVSYLNNVDNLHESMQLSGEQSDALNFELRRAYWDICNTCQQRLARLISSRLRPTVNGRSELVRMTVEEMNSLAEICTPIQAGIVEAWRSIAQQDGQQPQQLPPSQLICLRHTLIQYCYSLIEKIHEEKRIKLSMILQHERWQVAAVPRHMQNLVEGLFQSGARLVLPSDEPNEDILCFLQSQVVSSPKKLSTPSSPALNGQEPGAAVVESENPMYIKVPKFGQFEETVGLQQISSEPYLVIGTVVLLIPIFMDYLRLFRDVQFGVTLFHQGGECPNFGEVISGRLADLLNNFNSSTYRLILGAEAIKSADLQSISSRNMALALRSLEFVLQCIEPMDRIFCMFKSDQKHEQTNDTSRNPLINVRQSIRYSLPGIQLSLKEHVEEISRKLESLLVDRIKQKTATWQAKPPVPSAEIRAICQSMSKLSSTVMDILSSNSLMVLLTNVHEEFKLRMRQRLMELDLRPDGGPLQGIVEADVNFYLNAFRSLLPVLSSYQDTMDDLWSFVNHATATDLGAIITTST